MNSKELYRPHSTSRKLPAGGEVHVTARRRPRWGRMSRPPTSSRPPLQDASGEPPRAHVRRARIEFHGVHYYQFIQTRSAPTQPSRCVTTRPPAPRTPPGRTDGTAPAPSPRRRPRRDRRATAPAASTRSVKPQLFCYSSCCYRRRQPSTGPPRPPHPPTRTEPRQHLPPSSRRRPRRERRAAAPATPTPPRHQPNCYCVVGLVGRCRSPC